MKINLLSKIKNSLYGHTHHLIRPLNNKKDHVTCIYDELYKKIILIIFHTQVVCVRASACVCVCVCVTIPYFRYVE